MGRLAPAAARPWHHPGNTPRQARLAAPRPGRAPAAPRAIRTLVAGVRNCEPYQLMRRVNFGRATYAVCQLWAGWLQPRLAPGCIKGTVRVPPRAIRAVVQGAVAPRTPCLGRAPRTPCLRREPRTPCLRREVSNPPAPLKRFVPGGVNFVPGRYNFLPGHFKFVSGSRVDNRIVVVLLKRSSSE